MDEPINQEVLAELRKLRRVLYLIVFLLIVAAVPAFYAGFTRGRPKVDSWDQVTTLMRRQDFAAALSMANALVARHPKYAYGHAYLGAIYLAMDDVVKAESAYSRAYDLYPCEESEKDLVAVRKRIAAGGGMKLLSK